MTAGGTKIFSVTMNVPQKYQKYSMRNIEGIFKDMCEAAIKDTHVARTDVHTTLRGIKCTFQVSFGVRREETEALYTIVSNLAEAALYTWIAEKLREVANRSVQATTNRYARLHTLKPKEHISVKPKEHIKLC